MEGRYFFDLHFRLYQDNQKPYLVRSMQETASGRSCSVELDLEPGSYTIRMKITPSRNDTNRTPEDVMRKCRTEKRSKVLAIGQNFDQVHSKGRLREAERTASRRMRFERWEEGQERRKSRRVQVKEERRRNGLRCRRVKDELKKKQAVKQADAKAERVAKKPILSDVPPRKAAAEKRPAEEGVPPTEGHVESSWNYFVEVEHPSESIREQRDSSETEATSSGAKDDEGTSGLPNPEKTIETKAERLVKPEKPVEVEVPSDTHKPEESEERTEGDDAGKAKAEETSGGAGHEEAEKVKVEETSGGVEEPTVAQPPGPERKDTLLEEQQQGAPLLPADEVDDVSEVSVSVISSRTRHQAFQHDDRS